MTKDKATTPEERIEIITCCIEHGKAYRLVIQKYSVSYNQIYSWVRKKGSGDTEKQRCVTSIRSMTTKAWQRQLRHSSSTTTSGVSENRIVYHRRNTVGDWTKAIEKLEPYEKDSSLVDEYIFVGYPIYLTGSSSRVRVDRFCYQINK